MKFFLASFLSVLFSGCERDSRTDEDVLNSFLEDSILENRVSGIRKISKGKEPTFSFSVHFSDSFLPADFLKMSLQEVTDQKKKRRIIENARNIYEYFDSSLAEYYVFEGLYSGLWLEGVKTEKSAIIFANRF